MDNPFFIVGSPRSGTTLIKTILDTHPRVAIPPESHFIVALAPGWAPWRRRPATVEDIIRHPEFARWRLDPDLLRRDVARASPSDYSELVSATFEHYASREGKPGWGDKTPGYVRFIPTLARLFPDARVLHVIRDGRDVATSLSEQTWGMRTAIGGAFWWRRHVSRGIRDGRKLPPPRYLEIRLEDLIDEPEATVKAVCSFIGEDFHPEMLEYHKRFEGRGLNPDVIHLSKPVSPGLRDWRAGRTRLEQRAIEAVCRRWLLKLGYPGPSRRDPLALAFAWLVWGRDLFLDGPKAVRNRLSPRKRSV